VLVSMCAICVSSTLEAVTQQMRWPVGCRPPKQEPYYEVYDL
jgi:hypothetical protein